MNDLAGKVVVVTGASSGIGRAASLRFAELGATVVLVGRNRERLQAAVLALTSEQHAAYGYPADFDDLSQVRELARALSAEFPRIDVLCNNAGGVLPRRELTRDGFERTLQANHLAGFLLTALLRPNLAGGRVITTSSAAHARGELDPGRIEAKGRYSAFNAYGASKQANILFAAEAARRWEGILSFSYHPGVVRTRFGRDSLVVRAFYAAAPFLLTPEEGADTMVWLATQPASELVNGGYHARRRLKDPRGIAADPQAARVLWDASAAAVGLA